MLQVCADSSFSVPPLVMHICPGMGTVTHMDTICGADAGTAQHAGKALREHGRKILWIFVFWAGLSVFFPFELRLMTA